VGGEPTFASNILDRSNSTGQWLVTSEIKPTQAGELETTNGAGDYDRGGTSAHRRHSSAPIRPLDRTFVIALVRDQAGVSRVQLDYRESAPEVAGIFPLAKGGTP
jgi:hypothetical protein